MFGRNKEPKGEKIKLPRTGPELLEAGIKYRKEGSFELAYQCFFKGMEKKYIPCQTQMAYLYLDENYPERDEELAFTIFRASYSAGDTGAGIMMSNCLMRGLGTPENKSEACRIMGDIAKKKPTMLVQRSDMPTCWKMVFKGLLLCQTLLNYTKKQLKKVGLRLNTIWQDCIF